MPTFSIIIPCYNAADTLADTLQSICAQTLQDWEAICVDDGSTDDTMIIVANAARHDDRIKLARNKGKGPSAARNYGAECVAKGKIISFCDADDLWSANKLAEVASFFEQTGCDATFGQIAFFEKAPSDARVFSTVPRHALSIDDLLGENPVCTMSNLSIQKASLAKFGRFDETVVYNEDLEWLVRIVGQGASVLGQKSQQVWYRTSPTGLSSNLSAMNVGRKAAIKTAMQFGVIPSRRSNAIYQRYLARRALRMGHGKMLALRLTLAGVAQSPRGFMTPPRRGALTLLGTLANFILPRPVARAVFS